MMIIFLHDLENQPGIVTFSRKFYLFHFLFLSLLSTFQVAFTVPQHLVWMGN